jgi:hypothetical protein
MRIISVFLLALLFAGAAVPQAAVQDVDSAGKIAEKALRKVYGKRQIESPLNAKLDGNVWVVTGTLHCRDSKGNETGICAGGVAEARISKDDGRVLSVTHTK